MSLYHHAPHQQTLRNAHSFSLFRDSLLQDDSLPLMDVLDSRLFDEACAQFELDFAPEDEATALLHKNGQTERWLLVRMNLPQHSSNDSSSSK